MELRKATKQKSKLRLGLAGTSGSGKTYSALLIASGMTSWNKIAVIDTENGSADLYSNLGPYNVITLTAPFTPERYIEAIEACENAGMDVIVIDSITHEWDGVGGILQIHEQLGGNSFTAWGKLTPRHNAFVQKILQSNSHIITTVRRKQDYSMETVDGKTKVQKQGLKEVTREGFEYELTLSFAIEQNHLAKASKDRTGLFMDKPEFVISPETGRELKRWAESGAVAPNPDVRDTIQLDEYHEAFIPPDPPKTEPTKESLQAQVRHIQENRKSIPEAQPPVDEKPCPLHMKKDGTPMMMKYRPARDTYSHARQAGTGWEYCDGVHGFPSEKIVKPEDVDAVVEEKVAGLPL